MERKSNISKELERYSRQITELQDTIDSVRLMDIEDPLERLDALVKKETAMVKLAPLLAALEDLRNKHLVTTDKVKGNKSLSPLEDGSLDEE